MLPAHQCFGAGYLPVPQTDLRLVIHLEVPVCQRAVQQVDKLLFKMHPRGDARVVERAAPVLRGLAFAGGVRAVLHYSDIEPWLLYKVGARQQRQIIGRLPLGVESVDVGAYFLQPGNDGVLPVLVQAQEKVSGLTARGGLVRPDMASQHLHHMAQRIVALFGAENLIDEAVVHQVQRNNGEGARLCAIQNTAAGILKARVVHAARHRVHKGDVLQLAAVAVIDAAHNGQDQRKQYDDRGTEPEGMLDVCIGIMGDDVGGQDCEKHPVKRFQWIVGHDHVHAVRGGKYDYSAHICLHIGLHLSYGRGQLRILVCDKQVVQGEEKVQVCGRDDYVAVAVNNTGNAVAVKAVGRDQCLHVGFVALSGQNAENASLVDDGNGIKDALVFQKGNAAFPCRGSLEARQAAEIMRGSIGADALPLYIAQNKLRKTKHLCSLL